MLDISAVHYFTEASFLRRKRTASIETSIINPENELNGVQRASCVEILYFILQITRSLISTLYTTKLLSFYIFVTTGMYIESFFESNTKRVLSMIKS